MLFHHVPNIARQRPYPYPIAYVQSRYKASRAACLLFPLLLVGSAMIPCCAARHYCLKAGFDL